MSKIVKKMKIMQQDGTFTDYIPLGAEAENINVDGESVKTKLGKKPYYYDTVADMKADTKLKAGDMAATLGYYSVNDGGRAEYKIVNAISQTDCQEELNNNLFATLIVNDYVTPEMFGAYGDGIHDDSAVIQKLVSLGKTILFENKTYKCNNTITINKSCKLLGAFIQRENDRVYIDFSDNVEDECIIFNKKGIIIENLNFKGLRTKHTGFTIESESRYTFRNCGFYYFNKAIYTNRGWSTSFYDCVFEYCDTCVEFNGVNTSFLFNGTIFYSSTNGIVSNQELDYSNIVGGGFDHVDRCIYLNNDSYANNITLLNCGFEDYVTGIQAVGNSQATVVSCTFLNTERTVETYKGAGKIVVINGRSDTALTPNKEDVIYISPILPTNVKISNSIISNNIKAYTQLGTTKFYDYVYPCSNGTYFYINYESNTEFDIELSVCSTDYPETYHITKYSTSIAKTQGTPATFTFENQTENNRVKITFNKNCDIRVKGYMKYSGTIS